MDRRAVIVGVVGLLVVLAGCAQDPGQPSTTSVEPSTTSGMDATTTTAPATTTSTDDGTTGDGTTDGTAADEAPPDPPSDRLGWEGGYWYNESLPIDDGDGLNETELDMVVKRSMARVEQIRELEFDREVPVEVVSRETYQEEFASAGNDTEALQTFDNVKFESLFLVGEQEDSLAVQDSNRGSNVLGFYSPAEDRIVVVSESKTPQVTETTLGHELVHALQFEKFDTGEFNSSTRELHNARNGIIEGDARYVDAIYDSRCGVEWSCTTQESSGGGGGSDLHFGIYLLKYFPYSDGPGLVASQRSEGGWEAVNDVYDQPPESAEQIVTPRKYLEDSPTDVDLADRSGDGWSKVTPEGRAPYGSVGQPSLTAMFAYTAYDGSRSAQPVLGQRQFLNVEPDGTVNSSDPINYNVSLTNGWDGDKLWVYENGDGDTAYTWRLAWDSAADAEEFATGYRQLLSYWGGEEVDGADGVWRIPEDESEFADAFYLEVDGDTVTIVNAPSTGALSSVHADAPSP